MQLKLHPTFYASCCLLGISARSFIKQAHEWGEVVIDHDELNSLVKTHCLEGEITAVVWRYCVAVLTGGADPMEYEDDEKGTQTDTQGG